VAWVPLQPLDGETVTITARVTNQGDRGESPAFHVRVRVDGVSIGQIFVQAGLVVGQDRQVALNWVATPDIHRITAVADVNGAVRESDESNNELASDIDEILAPDLTIVALEWHPTSSISHGEIVSFTATIHNASTAAERWKSPTTRASDSVTPARTPAVSATSDDDTQNTVGTIR